MNAKKTTYKNEHVSFDVVFQDDGDIRIRGSLINPTYFAPGSCSVFAAKQIDRMTNYSGSGLPFPNASVAFDNTPNKHTIDTNGLFDVVFKYPNGYYKNDAFVKIPPSIYFSLRPKQSPQEPFFVQFELPDPLPLRTLGYRSSRSELGPFYYSAKEQLIPIGSAQDTMLRYAEAKSKYNIA